MQEQQLRARQLVLQQQAASAVAAASKTQREVYVGNLSAGLVTADMLRQLFNSTMAAAFPDMAQGTRTHLLATRLHAPARLLAGAGVLLRDNGTACPSRPPAPLPPRLPARLQARSQW